MLYRDLEDVFCINKEYAPGEMKNQNKLPEELIKKLILYSSNENDMVCDFFQGNFTTAYVARKLGRRTCGYELNKDSYDYHIKRLEDIDFGSELSTLKKVENIIPKNQGKKISQEEALTICKDYKEMLEMGMSKGEASKAIQSKYDRGRFSIKNIISRAK